MIKVLNGTVNLLYFISLGRGYIILSNSVFLKAIYIKLKPNKKVVSQKSRDGLTTSNVHTVVHIHTGKFCS